MQAYVLKELTTNSSFLDDLVISFDTKFTVIQSPNGGGKTSIFNAMKKASWNDEQQAGQFKILLRQNTVDSIYEDLIYIDERAENLTLHPLYKKCLHENDFLNLLKKEISIFCDPLSKPFRKPFNTEEAFDFSSILSQFSYMATGEKAIFLLCLIKTLREYIEISGAVILDAWPLSFLDIAYRHLVIEILSSMSEQVVIFEGQWWSDFPKQFDLTNLNLIQLHPKRPPTLT
jgi:hypothetical protein